MVLLHFSTWVVSCCSSSLTELCPFAEFFAFTRFYIDRFHEVNHHGCSPGHFLRGYEELNFINSQANECVSTISFKLPASWLLARVRFDLPRCRQFNSKLKVNLSRKNNYNFQNFMASARICVREMNQQKIADVKRIRMHARLPV
jgi:hypothetical protein